MANYLEYLTSNESTAYPFRESAQGLASTASAVAHGISARLPLDFFADAVIMTPEKYYDTVYFDSVAYDGVDTYGFLFTNDAGGSVVQFSVTTPLPAVGEVIQVYDFLDRGVTARFVVGAGFSSYLASTAFGTPDDFDELLPMETAAVEFIPDRLSVIRVPDGGGGEVDIEEQAYVYEGFNVALTPDFDPVDDQSDTTDVTIASAPGLGLGRYNACDDSDAAALSFISRLANATSDDDGNLNLDSQDCYRVQPDPASNRIILYNDCTPCCDCEDYANVTTALTNVIDELSESRTQLLEVVERMNTHIKSYNDSIFPKFRTVGISVYLSKASPSFSTSGGTFDGGGFASIVVVLNNRVTHQVAVTGKITFTQEFTLRKVTQHGKQKLNATPGDPMIMEISGVIEPGTELRTHLLLTVGTPSLLEGQVELNWEQYGVVKKTIAQIDTGDPG